MPTRIAYVLALTVGIVSGSAFAQMDVDQADSLNFEAFHKDKKDAVKVWKDDKATVKTYDQNSTTPASTATPATGMSSTPISAKTTASSTAAAATAVAPVAAKSGQRFEIRERYTLSRSTQTPYSAFYVIEALHQQSAKLCAKGWRKLTERSEPVEQDFYMFYEIECL